MEELGYIDRYVAQLNPQTLGMAILAFVEISLDRTNPVAFDELRKKVADLGAVLEFHMIAGGFDCLLKVRVTEMAAYLRFQVTRPPHCQGSAVRIPTSSWRRSRSLRNCPLVDDEPFIMSVGEIDPEASTKLGGHNGESLRPDTRP
jgi:DNA-binding Lrp family transcriptional regulator